MKRQCARCRLDFAKDDYEAQERLVSSFRAECASVYGDENVVRSVRCQHCIRELLRSWLEIRRDSDSHRHPVALRTGRTSRIS